MINPVVEADIKELIQRKKYFEPFIGSSMLITGATGLLGSLMVKAMSHYAGTVYACCRSKAKFESVFEGYKAEKINPVFSDITDLDISQFPVDYIIHAASPTDSKSFVEKPVDTITLAVEGTNHLLSQSIKKALKGFIYLSSLEVYGSFPNCDSIKNVTESDYGYLEPVAVRSSYSEGKRLVETLCKSYHSQFGVPIKIARLCQTFGAGVRYNDNRVFAQFARSVIEDQDIVLKTKGETVRNYCYTTDAIAGILTILAHGKVGEPCNIANKNTTISIAEMANLFCKLYPESKSKVTFNLAEDAGKLGYNPVVKLKLDSTVLENMGWSAEIGLEDMIRHLVEGMRVEIKN